MVINVAVTLEAVEVDSVVALTSSDARHQFDGCDTFSVFQSVYIRLKKKRKKKAALNLINVTNP